MDLENPTCTLAAKPEHKALDSAAFNASELLRRMSCEGEAMERHALVTTGPSAQRSADIASCFFDTVQITGFFSRVGIGIKQSIKLCDPDTMTKKPMGQR